MAQLNALDHALLGDIAREVSIRIGEFTVAHDGTNDQIVIPLGPGVAVSATLIPVTSRVLGRETRLGTKLIVESINALDAGPTRKRAAPFDPEILFSRRREVVAWASTAIQSAIEQLAGASESYSLDSIDLPASDQATIESSTENPNESQLNGPELSPTSAEHTQALHDIKGDIAQIGGHLAQMDSVVWEIYSALEELRKDLAKARLNQDPVLDTREHVALPPEESPAISSYVDEAAGSTHHLDAVAVQNLRESISDPDNAYEFIRQQRNSAPAMTKFDKSFDTWDAIVSVASGNISQAESLTGNILWNGDPEASYALLVIEIGRGTIPQPIEEIVETASAVITERPQQLVAASRSLLHLDQIRILAVLSAAVSKTTALLLANDMLARASGVDESEVIVAIAPLDERRAIDAVTSRNEASANPAIFEAGLTLLTGLQDFGNGRRLIAYLVASVASATDEISSVDAERIIDSCPTTELRARAAEALLPLSPALRTPKTQRAIGTALKAGLNESLRTNGNFVASCRTFVRENSGESELRDLADSIGALLLDGTSEAAHVTPESAQDRDIRILTGKKVVVVGGFPPRWLDEIQALGCEVAWFQSEVRSRPPLDAIFNAAADADVVIVDRRVSHATTIPLRVFVRQRRIPIQDFVERNKGRFLEMLRSRFG